MLRINTVRNQIALSGLNNRLTRKNWNDTEKISMAPEREMREASASVGCIQLVTVPRRTLAYNSMLSQPTGVIIVSTLVVKIHNVEVRIWSS